MHAAVLVLCPMPVGPGNLPLLQIAVEAAQRGVKVLLLAPASERTPLSSDIQIPGEDSLLQQSGIAARDYTNGEGVKLIGALLQAGASLVSSVGEAVDVTKTCAIL